MPEQRRFKHAAGFTLIELMVAIAILGVLVSLGIPSFNNFIQRSRLEAAVSDLSDSFKYARSEAIQRNTAVRVDPVAGGYNDGWTVLVVDGATELRVHDQAFHPDISLTCTDVACTDAMDFSGRGTATSASFMLEHDVSGDIRYICVMLSGNVRVSSSACP